jgi:hypothetical protein
MRHQATEGCFVRSDGTYDTEAFFQELLDSPAADEALAKIAIERAMRKDGMTRETAERLYGVVVVGGSTLQDSAQPCRSPQT